MPIRLLSVVLVACQLTACSSMPLGSIVPLTRINIETTDLDRLRAAFRLPEALRARQGGVDMDVVLKVAGAPDRTTTFKLAEVTEPAAAGALPGEVGTGYVYRLLPNDIPRFEAVRQALAEARLAGLPGSLGMGIATKAFCTLGPLPAGPLLTSTYLLTSENEGYVTLSENLDLRQDSTIAAGLGTLEPC